MDQPNSFPKLGMTGLLIIELLPLHRKHVCRDITKHPLSKVAAKVPVSSFYHKTLYKVPH